MYPDNGVTDVPLVLMLGASHVTVAVPAGADVVTVTTALWVLVPPMPVQLIV